MKKSFNKKSEPYIEENIFLSLGPKDDVDEDNIYYNKFMTAINRNCKIIAFTGRYGVGKTSIINSILKKLHNKPSEIRVSLGDYKNAGMNNEHTIEEVNNIDINDIEIKILQQIIYTTNENKLPMSRFKRIKYISILRKILFGIFVLLILGLLYVYFPQIYIGVFGNLYDFCIKYIHKYCCIFICVLLFMFIWFVLYKFILGIETTISVSTLKYKDLEIGINNDSEKSVFNKYLDEIVYFFKQTKTHILVIEDLDRYGNVSLEIFKKLKELNFLLNSNDTIKKNGGVIFIYALRDDLFLNHEDRVKFFDYIIPVVSKFSSQNAKEYIMELYQIFHDKYNLLIDEKLLRLISIYIQDRRLLLNIFMEFKTYIDALKNNQHINYTELFAVICYKNINPLDFEKRLKYKGDLYNLFNYRNDFIKNINSKMLEENITITSRLDSARKQKINDIQDLKKSFLLDVIRKEHTGNYINNVKIYLDDIELTLDGFINNEIDTKKARELDFYYEYPGYGKSKIDSEIKTSFLDKVDNLNYNFKEMQNKIEFNKVKIEKNKEMTLEDILNIANVDELADSEKIKDLFKNKILISLVKNGFIKENFEKNLSFFKSGDLSPEDYTFLIAVDTNDKLNFKYKLNNTKEVIENIDTKDFSTEKILNFDICDYLLTNKENLKLKNFYSQFRQINDYRLKFLNDYFAYNKENFILLLKEVFSNDLVRFIYEKREIVNNLNEWVKQIIENIKLDLDENALTYMKKSLENDFELLNSIENNDVSKFNIIYLKPDIECYENIKEAIIQILYENSIYKSNKSFYDRLIDLYGVDKDYRKMNAINILYESEEFSRFKNTVITDNLFPSFYNSFETFDSDEKNILMAITDSGLNDENKLLILKNENNNINNIENVNDKELWKDIIENSYCKTCMENMIVYFVYINKIDDVILDMIENIGKNYHAIDSSAFQDFEKKLIYSEYHSMIDYGIIAKNYSYNIESFDEELDINDDLLEELIINNKVELNINNYNLLREKNIIALLKLIFNKFDSFIEIKNDINHDSYITREIMESNINIDKKIQLLDSIDMSDISSKGISILIDEIINNNIYLNDTFIEALFDFAKENDKIKYFIYLHKNNNNYINYLYKINDKINKIRDGKSTFLSFDYDNQIYELMKYLKSLGIINKCDIKKNKIKISYNKTTI